jgi:hypothetical protein
MLRYNPSAQYNDVSDTRIVVLSILAIVAAFAAFRLLGTYKLVTQYFAPPLVLNEQRLITATAQDAPFFKVQINDVSVNGTGLTESVYDFVGRIDSTTRHFGLMWIGEHALIVKMRSEIPFGAADYSGVMTHVSDDSNVLDIYNAYMRSEASAKDRLVPFVLDVDYDVSPWFAGLAFEVVLLLAGAGGLFIVWRRHFED